MTPMEKQALEYVRNTAGGATLGDFMEDHAPIGPALWRALTSAGVAEVSPGGRIVIMEAGRRLLGVPA